MTENRRSAHDGRGARHPAATGTARLVRDSDARSGVAPHRRSRDRHRGCPGDEGEIQVRGEILMNVSTNRNAMRCSSRRLVCHRRPGWFDDSGHLHFHRPRKHSQSRRGSSVSRQRSNRCSIQCLKSCTASCRLPHPVRGQVVGAAVVPSRGAQLSVEASCPRPAQPVDVQGSHGHPRRRGERPAMLPTGKIDRQALVGLFDSGLM